MADDDEFSAENFGKYRTRRAEELKQSRLASGEEAEDDEVRRIIAEQKQVQQSSLASTRNALKSVKESEATGTKTLGKLKDQTEQLSKVEDDIRAADTSMNVSYKAAQDLHKYDGLIPISFRNMFKGRKKREIDDQLDHDLSHIDKQQNKDLKKLEKREQRSRLAKKEPTASAAREGASNENVEEGLDMEAEGEINQNLEEISSTVANLKNISLDMNEEMVVQEGQIKKIDVTTTHVDESIKRTTKKLGKWL